MPAVRALVVALALTAGAGTAACDRPDPDGPEGGQAGSVAARTVTVRTGGLDRTYLLAPATGRHRPADRAVVVVLHQEGGTPDGVAAETALAPLRAQGATLVYPKGLDGSWAAGNCCGTPARTGVDDVGFVDAVLDDAARRTRTPPGRTALVGYSSGAMLVYRYVCSRPGRLTAAVVVSGSLESPCPRRSATPAVLALHGANDGTIGIASTKFITALGLSPRPAAESLAAVAAAGGCRRETDRTGPGQEVLRWDGCAPGTGSIEAHVIARAGHGWGNLGATSATRTFLVRALLTR